MAVLALVLAVPLWLPSAASARPTLPPMPSDVAMRMNGLFAKATPSVRRWVDLEARKLRGLQSPDPALVQADARSAFPGRQPALTPGQTDALAAMAFYQAITDDDSEARLALGAAATEKLEKLLERRSELLKILSALLRKFSDTDAAIVATLK